MHPSLSLVAAALLVSPAAASDLEIKILASGASAQTVAPGSTVAFELVGELCDANNLGLAAFRVDLAYSGGSLTPFAEPTTSPMDNFASPLGLANPAGYGGTASSGDLIQVGGAQNTINNFFAPKPAGAVITAVAHPGQPVVLASGSVTVPSAPGTYTISATEAGANVIEQGATGVPFWKVEPADVMVQDLTITVAPPLTVDAANISLSAGGTANFSLDAGAANAGRIHLMLGSVTGTSPGLPVGGLTIPLVLDGYTNYTLANPTSPPLSGGFGVLDGSGTGAASFTLPAASDPALAGITLHHAYILPVPVLDFASNAASFDLVP